MSFALTRLRVVALVLIAGLALAAGATSPAAARVFVGVGVGYPVYAPYYYPPPVYVPPPVVYAPPPVVYSPPPPVIVQQPGPAPASSWYWCENPQGYYPYVRDCTVGWRAVPAAPGGR